MSKKPKTFPPTRLENDGPGSTVLAHWLADIAESFTPVLNTMWRGTGSEMAKLHELALEVDKMISEHREEYVSILMDCRNLRSKQVLAVLHMLMRYLPDEEAE